MGKIRRESVKFKSGSAGGLGAENISGKRRCSSLGGLRECRARNRQASCNDACRRKVGLAVKRHCIYDAPA